MSYLEHLRAKRSLRDRTKDGNNERSKAASQMEWSDAILESTAETDACVGILKDARKANEANKACQTAQSTIPPLRKKRRKVEG